MVDDGRPRCVRRKSGLPTGSGEGPRRVATRTTQREESRRSPSVHLHGGLPGHSRGHRRSRAAGNRRPLPTGFRRPDRPVRQRRVWAGFAGPEEVGVDGGPRRVATLATTAESGAHASRNQRQGPGKQTCPFRPGTVESSRLPPCPQGGPFPGVVSGRRRPPPSPPAGSGTVSGEFGEGLRRVATWAASHKASGQPTCPLTPGTVEGARIPPCPQAWPPRRQGSAVRGIRGLEPV